MGCYELARLVWHSVAPGLELKLTKLRLTVKERDLHCQGLLKEFERMSRKDATDPRAVASGKDETQHDEGRMRLIHIGQKGSGTAHEEQPDKLRNSLHLEQEATNSASYSTMRVSLQDCASGERHDRTELVVLVLT